MQPITKIKKEIKTAVQKPMSKEIRYQVALKSGRQIETVYGGTGGGKDFQKR